VRQGAGIGRYTRELVRALLALNDVHRFSLFAATGGLPDERWHAEVEILQALADQELDVRPVRVTDDWLARIWHRLRLPIPVELFLGPTDIFYSPDFTLPPTRRLTRTLLTVHDLSFIHHPEAFVPRLRRYLERVVPRSIERADGILADSEHTQSDLMARFNVPAAKLTVITPGVDARFRPLDPGEPSARTKNPLPAAIRRRYEIGEAPYGLSVGTLQPRKNYVRLIRAFAKMRDTVKRDVHLLIGGGHGWLFEPILKEAGKHDWVNLLGFVEEEDLPTLYRGAALFAFPSLYEGFGLPVLEAMASGTPVVCSDTSSLPEVAGDAALLIDPLDGDELTSALVQAWEDDGLRAKMIEGGLTQAAGFTWRASAQRLLETIDSMEG
jgi:glycosyltransferase involved in cell wall biosynthesis